MWACACHVPLFMSPRPCGRARCAVHTHVDVHGRHGHRHVHTQGTYGRYITVTHQYMPVHTSTDHRCVPAPPLVLGLSLARRVC